MKELGCFLRALERLLGSSREALGRPLESSWGPNGRLLKAVEGLLRALGRLLGGSWEALGRLLEASKRHLGPKTVIASIFGRFLKKIGNFGRPSWRRFNIKIRIFWVSKRVSKIKLIFKAFWHSFWRRFGRVWARVFEAFWA